MTRQVVVLQLFGYFVAVFEEVAVVADAHIEEDAGAAVEAEQALVYRAFEARVGVIAEQPELKVRPESHAREGGLLVFDKSQTREKVAFDVRRRAEFGQQLPKFRRRSLVSVQVEHPVSGAFGQHAVALRGEIFAEGVCRLFQRRRRAVAVLRKVLAIPNDNDFFEPGRELAEKAAQPRLVGVENTGG